MAIVDIQRIIRQQDYLTNLLRRSKGRGVGFFDPESEPLVTNTVEVVGPTIMVETKRGPKERIARARVVTKSNGDIEVISGGIGSSISEADAKKILPKKVTRNLSKAFKIKS